MAQRALGQMLRIPMWGYECEHVDSPPRFRVVTNPHVGL